MAEHKHDKTQKFSKALRIIISSYFCLFNLFLLFHFCNYLPPKIINIPSWVWVSIVGVILGIWFFFASSNDFLLWISNVYKRIKSMLPTWSSLVINFILVYFLLLILIQLIVSLKIFPRYIVKILENSVPTIGSIFINIYGLVNNNKTVLKITAEVKPQSSNC